MLNLQGKRFPCTESRLRRCSVRGELCVPRYSLQLCLQLWNLGNDLHSQQQGIIRTSAALPSWGLFRMPQKWCYVTTEQPTHGREGGQEWHRATSTQKTDRQDRRQRLQRQCGITGTAPKSTDPTRKSWAHGEDLGSHGRGSPKRHPKPSLEISRGNNWGWDDRKDEGFKTKARELGRWFHRLEHLHGRYRVPHQVPSTIKVTRTLQEIGLVLPSTPERSF